MAWNVPKEGKGPALVAAAVAHGRALRSQPGCEGAHVLAERNTGAVVALSFFRTPADLDAAMVATRPVLTPHHLEKLLDERSHFHVFDVVPRDGAEAAEGGSPGTGSAAGAAKP